MGIKVLGVAWLLVGVAFATLSLAVVMRAPWWQATTYGTISLSLMLCMAGWPGARFGLVVNALIATLMLLALPWTWGAE